MSSVCNLEQLSLPSHIDCGDTIASTPSATTPSSCSPCPYTPFAASPLPITPLPRSSEDDLTDPRVCFISLCGLYRQWTEIPFSVLYDSILIFYCRHEWIFNFDSLTMAEFKADMSGILSAIDRSDITQCKEFITFLHNKEKQGRLLLIDPLEKSNKSPIDVRWYRISNFLKGITNPITQSKFKPIITDKQWWIQKFKYQEDMILNRCNTVSNDIWDYMSPIQFCSHVKEVESELRRFRGRFRPLLEILQQSNPTLVPMTTYDSVQMANKRQIITCVTNSDPKPKDVSSAADLVWDTRSRLYFAKKDGTVLLK